MAGKSLEGTPKNRLSPMATPELYQFGEYVLDVAERRLSKSGRPVPLAPKAHDLLVALVRRAGTLVTKRELLDIVWHDACVEEGILSVHVSALRKVLDADAGGADGRRHEHGAFPPPPRTRTRQSTPSQV